MKPNRLFRLFLIATCFAFAGAAPAAAAALVRGPYVQMGHFTNQSTVVWRTDSSADGAVDYGLTTAYGMTAAAGSGYQHEATITGLIPGTTYYYRVRSGGTTLASASFRSGKTAGTPFRIGLFSDTHQGGNAAIGNLLALAEPDLLLAIGDVTDDGLYSDLDNNLFSKMGAVLAAAPLYWTPGNHDVRDGFAACREAFVLPENEQSYSFEYADALIVSLNAEDLPGTAWLANALAASSKPWKIVMFHEPAYSPDGGHGENETIRDQYVPVMEQHGVQLMISGHNHFYYRSSPVNGLVQLITGPTGNRTRDAGTAPCYSQWVVNGTAAHTFVVLDVDGSVLRIRTFDEAGNQHDEAVVDRSCPFVLDGQLDSAAVQVTTRGGGQTLWAAQSNHYLYVATQDAGEGSDAFLFLASAPDALTNAAPWGKAGTAFAYDAFFADENDSNYSHGFAEDGLPADIAMVRSATPWCNGAVLEGVIDLNAYYGGNVPDSVYLAATLYANADAGALVASSQCPAGNGDGNLDPGEVAEIAIDDVAGPVGPSPSAAFSPAAPSDCGPIAVAFNAATSALATATTVNAFYHFSTNGDDWALAAMTRTGTNTFTIAFDTVPDNAPQLEICFTDGTSWEHNGGANWNVAIRDCEAPLTVNGVTIVPGVPVAGHSVQVTYDPAGRALAAAGAVNVHHGYNRTEGWTTVPGAPMAQSGSVWTCTYVVSRSATEISLCFNDGTTWDNNGGTDWVFSVAPSDLPPIPDGVAITNCASPTVQVDHATAHFAFQGTAGTNLAGPLRWTNSATGQGGSFERDIYWNHGIDLAVGDNEIQIFGVIAGTEAGSTTVAVDQASTYAAWTNGSAQGTGWIGGWSFYVEGTNAGHFLDAGSSNCSAGASAFGLWANSGSTARARRALAAPMQAGDVLAFLFDNNWIQEGGSTGFSLENAGGESLLTLYFVGGALTYQLQDGNPEIRDTGLSWTGGGLSVAFGLDSETAYTLSINGVSFTGTLIAAASGTGVAQFQTWNYDCGADMDRNVYFNSLELVRPEPGGEESYSVATVHVVRAAGEEAEPVIASLDALAGGGLRFNLATSISGAQYALYASETLFPTQNWQAVAGTVQTGTGGALELSLTNGLPALGFYRIGYVQP
ncbi:MAG: metallophosphoesterase [Kiritimatiellia bacterium]